MTTPQVEDVQETADALDAPAASTDLVRAYLKEDWPGEWQQAAALSDWRDLHLTPEQLHNLNEEIAAVIDRYTTTEPAGANEERVIVQLQSFPRRS